MTKLWMKIISATIIYLILFWVLLFHILSAPVNYNEHMYLATAVLWAHHQIYQDFIFPQMPYLPVLYGLFYKITGTSYHLLSARLFTWFFTLLSAGFSYLIVYKLTKKFFYSLIFSIIFCLAQPVLIVMQECSNYMMPMAFSLMGYYFFLAGVEQKKISKFKLFSAGLFLSIAIGAKLYYAPLLLAFGLYTLFYPRDINISQRILQIILPFALGIILGQALTIYYIVSDPGVFYFNNYKYYFLSNQHLEMAIAYPSQTLFEKIIFVYNKFIKYLNNTMLLITLLVFYILLFKEKRYYQRLNLKFIKPSIILITMLLIISWITVFIPTPMWPQYLAMPVPFMVLGISDCISLLKQNRLLTKIIFGMLVVITIFFSFPEMRAGIIAIPDFKKTTSFLVHENALAIKRILEHRVPGQKVAVLENVFILDGKPELYPELGTGLFVLSVSDYIPEKYQGRMRYVPRSKLFEFLDANPPGAILVSPRPFNQKLREYAQARNYLKYPWTFMNDMTLFLKPKEENF